MRRTETLTANDAGIARAAALLRDGELVAFPTETVYGLGADATDAQAVARVFQAKGRPRFNPLIAHVPTRKAASDLIHLADDAQRLADAFWPGPLTLVAPLRPEADVADLARAGLPTLAVRVPGHPVAQALLQAVGRPVVAPSANPSGQISPTTASHVRDGLGGRIAAVLDAGPCEVGLESTIVGFGDGNALLLRPGGLPAEDIEACLGRPLASREAADRISAPGQLESHYAPDAPLRLDAPAPAAGELYLAFGQGTEGGLSLSLHGDLVEASANLFAMLRRLDAQAQGRTIAVAPIPEHGLGRAINDRLRRAAAPRHR